MLVFSSGFAEEGTKRLVATSTLRVLGPNSEGFVNLLGKIAANFSPTLDLEDALKPCAGSFFGPVATVNQSWALGFSFFRRGLHRGLASSIGYPVAPKPHSPQVVHKTDTGALCLDIQDETGLRDDYKGLLERVRQSTIQAPGSRACSYRTWLQRGWKCSSVSSATRILARSW